MESKIKELKDLHAKATPGEWYFSEDKDADAYIRSRRPDNFIGATGVASAALIVAMRNALPELIAEIERLQYDLNLCHNQLKYYNAHGDAVEEMRCKDCQDIAGQSASDWKARAEKAEAELIIEQRVLAGFKVMLETAKAERNALINILPGFCGVCPVAGTEAHNNCPRSMAECPHLIASWAAQEAAKRGAEVRS